MNESGVDGKARPSMAYPWLVVAILMVAYVFSFVDRQILNLLVGPIRRDLGISDTQMSLLMGFSFAIFYTILGIPLGRLADRWNRRWLVDPPREGAFALAKALVAGPGLGLAPGAAFGDEGEGWLRWCFASRDLSRLDEGLHRLKVGLGL